MSATVGTLSGHCRPHCPLSCRGAVGALSGSCLGYCQSTVGALSGRRCRGAVGHCRPLSGTVWHCLGGRDWRHCRALSGAVGRCRALSGAVGTVGLSGCRAEPAMAPAAVGAQIAATMPPLIPVPPGQPPHNSLTQVLRFIYGLGSPTLLWWAVQLAIFASE